MTLNATPISSAEETTLSDGMHQYIERDSRKAVTESFLGNELLRFLYGKVRERPSLLYRCFANARVTSLLSFLHFETEWGASSFGSRAFLEASGIDPRECLHNVKYTKKLREIFLRKIRYWECRPMPNDPAAVVSPSDSRVLLGSFRDTSMLFLKGKFFDYEEMLGKDKKTWLGAFQEGDFAVFRLTMDKYHYNHTPVAGKVIDFYRIHGSYHSCHPQAVLSLVTPYSKNLRVVTILDTDVPGGTWAGTVAMIEIAALMIGDIRQCYSEKGYEAPKSVGTGLFLKKGCPKSVFYPGSSTVVLLFQKGRMRFADDLYANMHAAGVKSLYSEGFGKSIVETDVKVRSFIGTAYRNIEQKGDFPR